MKHRLLIVALSTISLLSSCNNTYVIEYEELAKKVTILGYHDGACAFDNSSKLIVYNIFDKFQSLCETYTFLKSTYRLGTTYEITLRYPKAQYTQNEIINILSTPTLINFEFIKDIKLVESPEIVTYSRESFMYDEHGTLCGIDNIKFTNYIDNSMQDENKDYSFNIKKSFYGPDRLIKPLSEFNEDNLFGFYAEECQKFFCFNTNPNFNRLELKKAPQYDPKDYNSGTIIIAS